MSEDNIPETDNEFGGEQSEAEEQTRSGGTGEGFFTFSEVIRDSWKCYRYGFAKLLLLVLIVTLPIAIIQVFIVDMNMNSSGISQLISGLGNSGAEMAESVSDYSGSFWSRLFLYYGITAFLTSISFITEAAAVIMVGSRMGTLHIPEDSIQHQRAANGDLPFQLLFELAFKSFPKLWLTMFLVILFELLGFFLCILPGIFLFFVFIFSAYCVELTGLWGRKAMFVSSLCTRRFPKASLLFALLNFVLSEIVLSLIISGLASLAALTGVSGIGAGVVEVVLICLKQLGVLYIATSGAVLFSKMLPSIEPMIANSGIRGGRTD
ncbi:MAG: hypothetical protein J5950_04065 [Clostridia bacterium]|nr:hypothetical protein [Clostridia bacterium]